MSDLEPIPLAGLVDLNKPEMTRQNIADVLGMSRQTVTSIEEKAVPIPSGRWLPPVCTKSSGSTIAS